MLGHRGHPASHPPPRSRSCSCHQVGNAPLLEHEPHDVITLPSGDLYECRTCWCRYFVPHGDTTVAVVQRVM